MSLRVVSSFPYTWLVRACEQWAEVKGVKEAVSGFFHCIQPKLCEWVNSCEALASIESLRGPQNCICKKFLSITIAPDTKNILWKLLTYGPPKGFEITTRFRLHLRSIYSCILSLYQVRKWMIVNNFLGRYV